MAGGRDLTGVLVVRAWIEDDPGRLKARITHTVDVTRREQAIAAASSRAEIHTVVDRWLDAFLAEAAGGDGAVTRA